MSSKKCNSSAVDAPAGFQRVSAAGILSKKTLQALGRLEASCEELWTKQAAPSASAARAHERGRAQCRRCTKRVGECA